MASVSRAALLKRDAAPPIFFLRMDGMIAPTCRLKRMTVVSKLRSTTDVPTLIARHSNPVKLRSETFPLKVIVRGAKR